jgi:hypothetical protein
MENLDQMDKFLDACNQQYWTKKILNS